MSAGRPVVFPAHDVAPLVEKHRRSRRLIHLAYIAQMMVSTLAARTAARQFSPPPWVTHATRANPDAWLPLDSLNQSGKYAFWWPVALIRASSSRCVLPHAYP